MKTKDKIKDLFFKAMQDEWKEPFIAKAFKILTSKKQPKWDQALKDEMSWSDEGYSNNIIETYLLCRRKTFSTDEAILEWLNDPEIVAESEMWGKLAEQVEANE